MWEGERLFLGEDQEWLLFEQRPKRQTGKGGGTSQRYLDAAPAPPSPSRSSSEWLSVPTRGSLGEGHHLEKPHLERDLGSLQLSHFPQGTVERPLSSKEFQFLSKMGIPSLPTSWEHRKDYTVVDDQGLAVSVPMECRFLCSVFYSGMQWQSLYPEDGHYH